MKKFLLTGLLAAFAFAIPLATRAQQASELELQVVQNISKCLLSGLPEDWRSAFVVLELDAPGSNNGEVSYVFLRSPEAEKFEPFTPCDQKAPATALLEVRKNQAPERRNWKFARLTLHRDGKFEVKYEY